MALRCGVVNTYCTYSRQLLDVVRMKSAANPANLKLWHHPAINPHPSVSPQIEPCPF